jgi:hypothetical protein
MVHSTLLDRIVKGSAPALLHKPPRLRDGDEQSANLSPASAILAQARKVAILSTDIIAGD